MPRREDTPEAQAYEQRALDAYERAAALADAAQLAQVQARLALADAWRAGASLTRIASALQMSRRTLYNHLEEADGAAPTWGVSFPEAHRVSLDGRPVTEPLPETKDQP